MRRSSKSRIWNEARSRMAISSSEWPCRCSVSISSPIARASSSESQAPVTFTFSPGSSSVHNVLPCRPTRALPRQPQPQKLRHVGVLIYVDQDVLEPLLVAAQHVGLLAKQANAFDQQVAEVDGVERLEPLLIGGVELLASVAGEACGL